MGDPFSDVPDATCGPHFVRSQQIRCSGSVRLETELASHSQTQIPRDAPVSSMPDMNSRPSGGASLDNRVPPPAHSTAPPSKLLPSPNKPMGRTTEDSARAPQKEKPRCALGSHEDMALGSESPTPVLEHKHAAPEPSPTSESREDRCSRLQLCGICETCGRDIPVGQCFTSLEGGLNGGLRGSASIQCYICDGSQHKFAAPEKACIRRNSRSGLQHGHAEPKENLPKQGRHTRFPNDDATNLKNTRVPDNDATDANSCNVNLAGRCALTDTNRGLSTLSSSKPSMGSGPVDSPDLVPRNAKPSHDDISPAPDADATSLGSPRVPLSNSQKKRLKKKKSIQAQAKLDAKAQCDSQRVPFSHPMNFFSSKGMYLG